MFLSQLENAFGVMFFVGYLATRCVNRKRYPTVGERFMTRNDRMSSQKPYSTADCLPERTQKHQALHCVLSEVGFVFQEVCVRATQMMHFPGDCVQATPSYIWMRSGL